MTGNESKRIPQLKRLVAWTRNTFKSRHASRLQTSIRMYRTQLEYLRSRHGARQGAEPAWAEAAAGLLDRAQESSDALDVDGGFRSLHSARATMVLGFDQDELKSAAVGIREESDKIGSSWRKKAIYGLIGHPDCRCPKDDVDVTRIHRAACILHEAFDNQYYKIGILKDQLGLLAVIYISTLILIAVLAAAGMLTDMPAPFLENWFFLTGVLLFGLLGGSFSAMLSAAKAPGKSKIPEQVSAFVVALVRVSLGAGSALVVCIFLASGLLESITDDKVTLDSPLLFYAIAFASGFSERLLVRAVETVAGKGAKS